MRQQQPVVVRQPAHVIHRLYPFIGPYDIAVPVIFDEGFIRTDIEQMAIGQQAAAFIEMRLYLPGMDHSAVHVNEPDITGDLALGPELSRGMIALGGMVSDQDITVVAFRWFVNRCAGGEYSGIAKS